MFRHHKYCVIDIAGLLVASQDHNGSLAVYLLDGVDEPTADKSKRVKITDPGLIEFIRQHTAQLIDHAGGFMARAQITGTVNVDDGEVHLVYVSQAFIHDIKSTHDKKGALKYDAKS